MPDSRQKSGAEFTHAKEQIVLKGGAQGQLDTEAILIAKEALTKIDSHEETCAKRWAQAVNLLRVTVGGVFMTLVGMVGYLINYALTLPHH